METKKCTKCGKELPIDQFNFRDKAKGTRRADCKNCHNGYMKKKYQEKQEAVQDLKAQCSCVKCGDKRGYLLDYHHINPNTKKANISRLLVNTYDINNPIVQEEIKKCIVLCANCHREWHYFSNLYPDLTFENYLKGNIPGSSNR